MPGNELCVIIDFGSQYTRLIARRVREKGVFCRILPYSTPAKSILSLRPAGIILSGGPACACSDKAPIPHMSLYENACPVLGICYGLQVTAQLARARVSAGESAEYGPAFLHLCETGGRAAKLFNGLPDKLRVWMSHGDRVEDAGDFTILARTDDCPVAAAYLEKYDFWGLQFHPEVSHSEYGERIIENFLFPVCGFSGDWKPADLAGGLVERIRAQVGGGHVLIGLSGGVDSSVTAALCAKALGDRAHAVFVDNGLLRAGEREQVENAFTGMDIDLRVANSGDLFLKALEGLVDPERKRKAIGHTFIDVFREQARIIMKETGEEIGFLAQGTLYPDVIESLAPAGAPSVKIKSHHNVGGLPERLGFELVEPLRDFFKDEVRAIGRGLGLDESLLIRHPFPGPGLAVRIIGEVTRQRLEILRAADEIVVSEIREAGLYQRVFQVFAVLLPPVSVGVMGDDRTDEHVVAVRSVDSSDAMTADWTRLPYKVLDRMARRISNRVHGVNRVVYDITSKPPATIEWQ